jgi:hypothetical protein
MLSRWKGYALQLKGSCCLLDLDLGLDLDLDLDDTSQIDNTIYLAWKSPDLLSLPIHLGVRNSMVWGSPSSFFDPWDLWSRCAYKQASCRIFRILNVWDRAVRLDIDEAIHTDNISYQDNASCPAWKIPNSAVLTY